MAYRHETTRRQESKTCEGVIFYLHKMTEGRRIDLRVKMADSNRRLREILKEQALLEAGENQDSGVQSKWLELQDEFDAIMVETINPAWLTWGLKKLEGLEVDGKPLDVQEWREFPSILFAEIVEAVKAEADLSGAERKNSELPTTSGEQVGMIQNSTTAETAKSEGSGIAEIAENTSQVM